MPNSVSVLIEKPKQLDERERADERHRDRDRRNQRGAPVLQEQEHDEDDERDRLEPASSSTSRIDSRDDRRRVERELELQPGREALDSRASSAFTPSATSSALAVGSCSDAEADARRAAKREVGRVVLGAELDAADVLQAHERAVGAALQDDVLELATARSGGPTARTLIWYVCPARAGGAPTCAGRDLHVLLAQRVHHVVGGELAAGEPCRDRATGASRNLRSPKMMHVADAGDALELVADEDVDVVADEQRSRTARRRRRAPRRARTCPSSW